MITIKVKNRSDLNPTKMNRLGETQHNQKNQKQRAFQCTNKKASRLGFLPQQKLIKNVGWMQPTAKLLKERRNSK